MIVSSQTASRVRSRRGVLLAGVGVAALSLSALAVGGTTSAGQQTEQVEAPSFGAAPAITPALSTTAAARFADTRVGGSTLDGLFEGEGRRAPLSIYEVDIAGRGDVPSDAVGAIVEVTAVGPSGDGFATVYPCTPSVPNASAINYTTGVDVANEVFAPLSMDGSLCVYTYAEIDLLIDVVGYVDDPATVKLFTPARIAESRIGPSTVDGLYQGFGRTTAGGTETIGVAGRAGVPLGAQAAIINVAAIDPTGDSFITVHPCLTPRPVASSLNHTAGVNRANELIAPLSASGNICVYTDQSVDLIIDVVGYVEADSYLHSTDPARFVETRDGATTIDGVNQGGGKKAAGSTTTVQIADRGDVPEDAVAVVVNVGAVDPDDAGFFTVDECLAPRPNTSSLNYTAGVNGANEVVVGLSDLGDICVYTSASTHIIVDVVGYLETELIDLRLLGINDYHGHLQPNTPGSVDGKAAGGAEYLSAKLNELREDSPYNLTVAAGDLIGGSPAFSGLFHDEPSVESLNAMHVDVSSVGNHEFDEGVTELLRMQDGGCHPVDGCYFPDEPYPGADFQWLAANVVNASNDTPLPPYWIDEVRGVKVGFIGMTLEGTDELVAASGIVGWNFLDEVDTANALVPELKAEGVEAIVVLLHEGASQNPPPGDVNACVDLTGPILAINDGLDPEIDAMITGHTHLPYNCLLAVPGGEPRIVTSAYSFGRVVSQVDLVLDRQTGEVVRSLSSATNHIVEQAALTKDPVQTEIIEKWQPKFDEIGLEKIGETTAAITRGGTPPGTDRGVESAAGNLVADAQLWATSVFAPNGAQIAFMNPGGLRSDLPAGDILFGDAFTFQPFNNTLFTVPMTGQQIMDVLEEQCQPAGSSRPILHLGVSEGFTYDLSTTVVAGDCTAITVSNMKLNGVAIGLATTYQVTMNNFLADGGDNFDTFGTIDPFLRIDGGVDIDALVEYFGANSPVAPPSTDRVNEI